MKNILIVGAGDAGRLLKKDIQKNYAEYRVVGFVDDQFFENRTDLLGKISDIPELLAVYLVDQVVIAIPSADGALVRRILLVNQNNAVPIKIVPRNIRIIGESDVRYSEVRDIIPEDFLGRPFMRQNVDQLRDFYRNKIVFVTGGAGSIGSEVVRQLIDLGVKQVVVYDNSEYLVFLLEQQLKESGKRDRCRLIVGNILHDKKLNKLFDEIQPDIVFHAAAYKHVHLMHDNIDEAIYNNVIGTKRVIDAVLANGVKLFTFISTDKVVNPTSVMGATKKLCEFYIRSIESKETQFNIVRFGNVINSNGSALPLFERQMALYKYITVTHKEMQRFFMSIREAAQLVIETTASGKPNTIHVLNMGELINIYEVALCLIRSKNLIPEKDVEVRIMGLRKGEKLVEELYTEKEEAQLSTSEDSRMYSLENSDHCERNIREVVEELEKKVKTAVPNDLLMDSLKELFPSIKN